MSPLPDDLSALAGDGPDVADWPGLVRRTVRARARRRVALSVAAALSLVVASSAGVVWARDGEGESTLVATSPTSSPQATATPRTAGATASEHCGKPAPPAPSVAPPPDDGDDVVDVQLAVLVSCLTVRVGEPLVVVATAAGDLFAPWVTAVLGGVFRGAIADCAAPPTGGPRPSPVPGARTERFEHTYDAPGVDDVVVTGAPLCGDRSGQATTTFRITVLPVASGPAEPTQSAASPATPEPTASAGPTYPPARNVVTIDITVTPARPRVGDEVTITIVARGDKATPYFNLFSWDRRRQSKNYPVAGCAPPEPGPYEPGERRDSVTFTYSEAGPETIRVRAESTCAYYAGSAVEELEIVVDPA